MTALIIGLALASASASTVPRPQQLPVLALRGGAYPPPKAGYHAFAARGALLSKMETMPNLLSGGLAGCFVAFGAILSITVASAISPGFVEFAGPGLQKLVFGALFPIALLNVVATGSQLATGNFGFCSAALYEGLIDLPALIHNWVVSYAGNMIGSVLFAAAINYSGLLTGSTAKMAAGIAVAKCKGAFGPTLVKGILANWLVCLAAFMATVESDLGGKIVGIWFCISAFVMIGLEHSIANMFIIPLGMMAGADVSVMDCVMKNWVPVSIGNIIAGFLVFSGSMSYIYGKLGGQSKD